jgi:6-pyruvoyltetrahydropterin/6-carboxytetrahydropterin synthase
MTRRCLLDQSACSRPECDGPDGTCQRWPADKPAPWKERSAGTKKYQVEKHYPHSLGLSACFRQFKSTSHCAQLHGYALAFTFTFEAYDLDHRDWVLDFGSLKNLKIWLEVNFDHRLIAASDDPLLVHLQELHKLGGCNLRVMERVGIESFAEQAGKFCKAMLASMAGDRVKLISVQCWEHPSNSAIWHAHNSG